MEIRTNNTLEGKTIKKMKKMETLRLKFQVIEVIQES